MRRAAGRIALGGAPFFDDFEVRTRGSRTGAIARRVPDGPRPTSKGFGSRGGRQREAHRDPLVIGAVINPYPAAVQRHDPVAERQAKTDAVPLITEPLNMPKTRVRNLGSCHFRCR